MFILIALFGGEEYTAFVFFSCFLLLRDWQFVEDGCTNTDAEIFSYIHYYIKIMVCNHFLAMILMPEFFFCCTHYHNDLLQLDNLDTFCHF